MTGGNWKRPVNRMYAYNYQVRETPSSLNSDEGRQKTVKEDRIWPLAHTLAVKSRIYAPFGQIE